MCSDDPAAAATDADGVLVRTAPTAEEESCGRRLSLLARVLVAFVRLYQQTLSHVIGGHCRFQPSCSHYGLACLRRHGALRGSYYTFRRLCRCHPFHRGGLDPPPPVRASRARAPDSRGAPLARETRPR